jgi:hypothetical protein
MFIKKYFIRAMAYGLDLCSLVTGSVAGSMAETVIKLGAA